MNKLEIMTICCECNRIKDGSGWHHGVGRDDVVYSHGYCPECLDEALARFSEEAGFPQQAMAVSL